MKSLIRSSIAAAVCLSLPAEASTLTPLQKQLVMNTLQSQALALAVARSVDLNKIPATPTNDAAGATFGRMLAPLQAAIASGSCLVSNDANKNESIGDGSTGISCPVAFSDNLNGLFRILSYSAKDPAFYSANDVVGCSLTVRGAAAGSTITFAGTGAILSQTLGSLAVSVNGSGTYDSNWSGSLDVHYVISFAAFKADFEVVETTGEAGGTVSYRLNDVPLTAAEVDFVKLPALQPQSKGSGGESLMSLFLRAP